MAGVKISQLPVVLTPNVTDIFPVVQGGVTYQAQTEQYFNLLNGLESATVIQLTNLNATYNNGASGVGATLVNAGSLAALVVDGFSVDVNDLVLVAGQTLGAQNGVYIVNNPGSGSVAWILERATTYNMPAQIGQGDVFTILYGNTQQYSQWIQTGIVLAIGTDPITFVSNVVAGSGITKVNNVISASDAGIAWNVVTTATTLASGNGYFANSGSGALAFTLPATSAFGDTYIINALNSNGWTLAQHAGQTIQIGFVATTTGTGGNIASTNIGDTMQIVCNTANTGFSVISFDGNLTVV